MRYTLKIDICKQKLNQLAGMLQLALQRVKYGFVPQELLETLPTKGSPQRMAKRTSLQS